MVDLDEIERLLERRMTKAEVAEIRKWADRLDSRKAASALFDQLIADYRDADPASVAPRGGWC